PVHSTRRAWTGSSMADSFQDLHRAVKSGTWVDELLAGGAVAVEGASSAIDPFSALFAHRLGRALEHFRPLREVLDKLTGIPDRVAAHAQTWTNMATEMAAMTNDLGSALASDMPDWQGAAADSYQSLMGHNVNALGGLSVLAETMAAATEA